MAYFDESEAEVAEEELRLYLAPHQPELAPRLARRLSQRPPNELQKLLRAFRSGEATPLLRRAVDEALAEELGSTGLVAQQEEPRGTPADWQAPLPSRQFEERAPRRRPQAASHSILERIASLQPELAPKLLEFIEKQGPRVVEECMQSDAALQRHVEAGLVELFAAEERAADPGTSQIFQKGPGHALPGSSTSSGPPVRTINASARPKSLQPSLATGATSDRVEEPRIPPAPKMISSGYMSAKEQEIPAPKPRHAEAETRPMAVAPVRPGPGRARRIAGLEELFDELGLSEYEEAASTWATKMGAAFLEELVENSEELAAALSLKPLEQKRLQRLGPEVAARLRRERPAADRPAPSRAFEEASRTEEAEAPVPDALPATTLWATGWLQMEPPQVRNTFIDIPSTATPLPSPPSSAPALHGIALKESLQQAVDGQAAEAGTTVAAGTTVRRAKPNPLNFLSQNSMVSIPEGADAAQTAGAALPQDPMKFLSGMSEMPATPAYTWGVLQTPTETPSNFGQFRPVTTLQYAPQYAMPAMATPTGIADPGRKTLSLQDMIQSPKVEDKAALLHSTYQQLYQVLYAPPMPQAGAPTYAVPAGPPVHYAEHLPPMQAPLAMPPPAVHAMPPAQDPMHDAPIYAVPTIPGPAPGTPPIYTQAVMGQAPGTPPHVYQPQPIPQPIPAQAPHPLPHPLPTIPGHVHAPAPGGCPSVALGLVHGLAQPPPVAQPPLQAHYGMPPPVAPTTAAPAPGVVMAGHPPPPPTFAAPSVVVSPKAAAAPATASSHMSESDIRTLLDVAMQSGNQEAVSAVARQAKAAGMSAEQFRSLLPAPNSAAR